MKVFFRLILVIPHLLWISIWQYAFFVAVVWAWFVALVFGRLEDDLHSFLARYVRYSTHLYAYMCLLAEPYPKFRGFPGYPVDVEIDGPDRQSRWVTGFRIILAIPALIFAFLVLGTVLQVVAIAAWFVALAIGRVPRGLRDLGAYCLRYNTQTSAYLCLLTARYPSLASGAVPPSEGQVQESYLAESYGDLEPYDELESYAEPEQRPPESDDDEATPPRTP